MAGLRSGSKRPSHCSAAALFHLTAFPLKARGLALSPNIAKVFETTFRLFFQPVFEHFYVTGSKRHGSVNGNAADDLMHGQQIERIFFAAANVQ